jgi:hypothetical protein
VALHRCGRPTRGVGPRRHARPASESRPALASRTDHPCPAPLGLARWTAHSLPARPLAPRLLAAERRLTSGAARAARLEGALRQLPLRCARQRPSASRVASAAAPARPAAVPRRRRAAARRAAARAPWRRAGERSRRQGAVAPALAGRGGASRDGSAGSSAGGNGGAGAPLVGRRHVGLACCTLGHVPVGWDHTRAGEGQPRTTRRSRGASFRTSGPSGPQTTMSSIRTPNRPAR